MKEYIFQITQASAGLIVVVTDVPETMAADNVLAVINKTQKKVLYSPMKMGNLDSFSFSSGTMTITLKSPAPSIAAGDKLLIKCYTDSAPVDVSSLATEANATSNKNAIINKIDNTQPDLSSVAKEASVSNATTSHTTIGMLEDSTNGLKAIKDKLDAHNTEVVTTHPYAKEATIGAATDEAAETTSSSLFAWVKKIRDYLYGIVTTAPYAKQTNLVNTENMVEYLYRGCSIVENSDSVGTGNQGYTIILDQTASVNDDTLNL